MIEKIVESLLSEDFEQVKWLQKAQNRAGKYAKNEVIELVRQAISLQYTREDSQVCQSPEAMSPAGTLPAPALPKKLDINEDMFDDAIISGDDCEVD